MQSRNNIMNSWLNINNEMSNDTPVRSCRFIRDTGRSRPGLIWLAAMGLALLVSAGPVFGQLSIQPMKLEVQVTPGKIVNSVLDFRNYDPNATHAMDLSVVELSQSEDGQWQVIEPNEINDPNSPSFGFDLSRLSSCKEWVRLKTNTVTLAPLQSVPVEVNLRVPRGLRGFYTAGIIASVRTPRGRGLTVRMEFLVPIIAEIEGRAVTPKIETTDVGLQFVPAGGAGPGTTWASMRIQNDGGTFSRLHPVVRVWALSGGYWRVITTREFGEHGILPGAKINLRANLFKNLPSGKYKVAGELYVDGRRAKRVQKEIDFVGDPKISQVAADRPLDLDPLDITIESLPGTTRTGMIKVFNGAEATVNVRTALGLPEVLQTRAAGDIKGPDLDCSSWLKVIPEQFTLQGEGGRQNLQIISTMPNPVATHPCYYSLLALWATYPDGQQAGVTTMPICIRNTNIQVQPKAEGLKIDLQDLGQSKFLIATTFGNYNTIHFAPITVRAGVIRTSDASGIPRASTYLGGNPRLMLPFEIRQFSGVMDFSTLPADMYLLVGRLEYAPGQFARTYKLIQISIEGEQRIARTLGTQMELGEVEVTW
ncbi:MAG: hypothetical protein JSW66_12910 [Phycisphaerales bacterium]|nr:MAG: hypothetical protein JSW66_12910 [Phycisphaerales bacterium]